TIDDKSTGRVEHGDPSAEEAADGIDLIGAVGERNVRPRSLRPHFARTDAVARARTLGDRTGIRRERNEPAGSCGNPAERSYSSDVDAAEVADGMINSGNR